MSQGSLRIYSGSGPGTGPLRPCRNKPTVSSEIRASKPRVETAPLIDGEIRRILDAIPAGESVQHAFDRKERELRTLIASLTPMEAAALHTRLTNNRKDELNVSFARLTAERRARVLSLLAETSRGKACAL